MVRTFVIALFAAAVLAAPGRAPAWAAAPAAPKTPVTRAVQSALAGNWIAVHGTPGTAPVQATLTLTQTGRVVAGTMKAGDADMFVVDVKQMGNAVSFSIVIPGTPYVTVPYTGTLMGGTLDMTGTDPMQGVYKLTAVRDAPPTPAPPDVVATATPGPAPAIAAPAIAAPATEPAVAVAIPIPIERPEPPAADVAEVPDAAPVPEPVEPVVAADAAAIPIPIERPEPPAPEATAVQEAATAPEAAPAPEPVEPAIAAEATPIPIPVERPEPPAPEVAAVPEAAPAPAPVTETPPQVASLAPVLRPAVPTAPPRAAAPPPPATLAGDWDAEQQGTETAQATLHFVATNGALTGTMRLNGEELTLYDVRNQDGKVSFSLVIPGSPYVTVRYEGMLAADTLMLAGMGDNMGTFTLSATRDGATPAPGAVVASLTPPAAPVLEPQLGLSGPIPIPRERPQPEVPPPAAIAPPPQIASLAPPAPAAPTPAPAVTLPDNLVLPQAPRAVPPPAPRPPPPVAQPTPVPLQPSIAERAAAAESDDLLGDWQAHIATPSGPTQDFVLSFRRTNGVLSGTRKLTAGDAPLTAIVRNGNEISFSLPDPVGAPRAYTGVFANNTLSLSSGNFFTGAWSLTARRQPPPAPALATLEATGPVAEKLPLPALRNVPANGLVPRPPMGWASRESLGLEVDDDAIRQAADSLDEVGLKALGYTYIELDDGWQGTRDRDGTLGANVKFPDMKALADHIHSKGLLFGLATSAGPKSCSGLEGSYGHEAQDAKIFASWGVDYVVVDWCGMDDIYPTQAERQAALQKMGEALATSGRDIAYGLNPNGKFDAGAWGARTGANLWRTSAGVDDNWKSVVETANAQAGREGVAGPGHWNDPGLIQTGRGAMSTDEYRTQMNLWALLAAPFMLGNDVRIMMRETVTLLTNAELIAIDQDPLGRQARLAAKNGDAEVWVKALADGSLAVGLFNFGNQSARVGATAAQLGSDGPRQVRDLWWHASIGTAVGGYDAFLTPHTSLLLKLSR